MGGLGGSDEVALRTDVVDDSLLLNLPVDGDDQAQVETDGGGGWDGVGGGCSGVAGGDAVDVQGWLVDELAELSAVAVSVAEDKLAAE